VHAHLHLHALVIPGGAKFAILITRFAVEFAGGSAPLVIRMLPLQERRNEATGAASCSIL